MQRKTDILILVGWGWPDYAAAALGVSRNTTRKHLVDSNRPESI